MEWKKLSFIEHDLHVYRNIGQIDMTKERGVM